MRRMRPLGLSVLLHAGALAAGVTAMQTAQPPAHPTEAAVEIAFLAPAADPAPAEPDTSEAVMAERGMAEPVMAAEAPPVPDAPVPDAPEIVVALALPLPAPVIAPPPAAPAPARPAVARPAGRPASRAATPGPAAVPAPVSPTAPADDGPVEIAAPRFRSPPEPPAYPRLARAQRQEGEVLVRARLDRTGTPEEVLLARSSGFDLLDRAALAAVRRWPFEPGRRGGVAVIAWVQIPVRFTLR